jgi:hypothetical protein
MRFRFRASFTPYVGAHRATSTSPFDPSVIVPPSSSHMRMPPSSIERTSTTWKPASRRTSMPRLISLRRKSCAVDFNHCIPPAAPTVAPPHGGRTARRARAQGRSEAKPRERLPCARDAPAR